MSCFGSACPETLLFRRAYNGLRIADVARALGARYIQPNGPTHRHWIVFDVDHAAATLSWDDVGAPAPNITVTNKANGHAHLIYGLDTPIRTPRMEMQPSAACRRHRGRAPGRN
ncbi:hypothetical protein HBJ33_028690 (plasmid) [Klebsiella pneumoniae]|uniref:replication initiation protein n=1 Tax=Klebsiella pneumoniae TaxID=573 RepID=UPI0015C326E2|nr:replication initiation protein [Klebsiella pneumoniae]QLF61815.1 hypothetical protein HBJ33_028690 [Klebsiella pneumoniae]